MNQIAENYLQKTSLESNNEDLKKIVEFLSKPETVNKMIVVSELGLPAITAVVQELESNYADLPAFELNLNKKENTANRRTVGWIIKYIMKQYGMFPMEVESSRMRLRKFSKNRYFLSGAIYSKVTAGKYKIEIISTETDAII